MRFIRKQDASWNNFKVLIRVAFDGFVYLRDFAVLLAIFVYVFAILGMKLYAGRFKFDALGYYDPDG